MVRISFCVILVLALSGTFPGQPRAQESSEEVTLECPMFLENVRIDKIRLNPIHEEQTWNQIPEASESEMMSVTLLPFNRDLNQWWTVRPYEPENNYHDLFFSLSHLAIRNTDFSGNEINGNIIECFYGISKGHLGDDPNQNLSEPFREIILDDTIQSLVVYRSSKYKDCAKQSVNVAVCAN